MAPMPVKLALTTLCENPLGRTGLSTLFTAFVSSARRIFPHVAWVVYAGPGEPWPDDPGVEVCRRFPANNHPAARLVADHFCVPADARRRGAAALVTVGFAPIRSGGLPIVMQVFAVPPRAGGGLRGGYRRWAVARGLARSALVVVNSAWASTQLAPARGRVLISPEGLDHQVFQPGGPAGDARVSGPYFLWVSNLYPYKRVGLALAAFAAAVPEVREKCSLVVVGGGWGDGRARAEAAAQRLGIAARVQFLGRVEDQELPALYRGAQAHVLSTQEETFGRTVLEAMACGCPCLVQDLPVLREVAGESALYVDFRDPLAAAAGMARLVSDAALRSGLGAAGAARSRLYSFERLARERVGTILQALDLPTS
jgi:glycosyltransferase involved in cell wall biosynthesis